MATTFTGSTTGDWTWSGYQNLPYSGPLEERPPILPDQQFQVFPSQPTVVPDMRYFVALLELLLPGDARILMAALRRAPDDAACRAAFHDELVGRGLNLFAELVADQWTP